LAEIYPRDLPLSARVLIGLIAIVTGFAAFGGYELAMIPEV